MKNKKVVTAITVAALCATAPATAAFAAQTGNMPGSGQQMAAEQMTEGEQQAPLAEGEQQAPPTEGEQQATPTEGEQQAPPTEGEQQAPPTEGEQQAPPTEGEQQAPPTEGEQQAPPTEGEQQAPPTEGEQQAPPTEGEQQAPPTEGEQQAPPAEGEQQAPPAAEQNGPKADLAKQIRALIDKLTKYLEEMELIGDSNKPMIDINNKQENNNQGNVQQIIQKIAPKNNQRDQQENTDRVIKENRQEIMQKLSDGVQRFLGIKEASGADHQQMTPGNTQQSMPGGMNSQQNAPESFDAAAELDADSAGESYLSEKDNENVILVSGKSLTLSDATVTKTGNANGEDADFYGTNAAVLANNGTNLTLTGANITTNGTHANAVFSNGSGTSITISDSTIKTSGNNSGGIMVTGGGSITADNLSVETSGNSSAAIRSDRGGGTADVNEGTYSTSGTGSPAIYSTADISVENATLSASASEAVVIEGGNSVAISNSNVSGNNSILNGQSTIPTNVLIYQSMSGDAQEGASTFTMNGGTLTSGTGAMFHVTNVSTTIDLTNVNLKYAADSDDFLIASADAWGNEGKNGGNVTLNLHSQTAEGNITVDQISSLEMTIDGNSSYTGAINQDGTAGTVHVILEDGGTWTLTGDSYITSFDGDYDAIDLNGYNLYVNGVQITK